MNISDLFKNLDKNELANSIAKAKDFLKTPEGKRMAEKFKSGDTSSFVSDSEKNKLLNEISKNPDILKQIEQILKR